MDKQSAIEYFGGVKPLAQALGCTRQAVYDWPDEVPRARQFEIQVITSGKLKADQKYRQSRQRQKTAAQQDTHVGTSDGAKPPRAK